MNLQSYQIDSFLLAAEYGSFSRAAEKLYISHVALIKQINSLERELGFSLFIRTNKGIILTESGAVFAKKIKKLQKEVSDTIETCRKIEKNGLLIRFGEMNDLDANYFRADLFSAFLVGHSDMSIKFVPTKKEALLKDLLTEKIDLGYYFDSGIANLDGRLSFMRIYCGNIGVVMTSQHPLSAKEKICFEDLKGYTLYADEAAFIENVQQQLAHISGNHLESLFFSMDNIFHACHAGSLVLLPLEFSGMFPSLICRPLFPPIDYQYSLVYRTDAPEIVRELAEFYASYVSSRISQTNN